MSIDISKGLYRAVLAIVATANRVITFPDRTFTVADNADVTAGAAALAAHEGDASTHLVGTIVGTTETQTISGKAISATGTTIPAIIAPSSLNDSGSVTTSGTAELTILTQTLTTPPVAGQIFVLAKIVATGPTVAGDSFNFQLYIDGVVVDNYIFNIPTDLVAGRETIVLMGQVAIASAAGKILKTTATRILGTGTITMPTASGTRQHIIWHIIPGAGTTA